MKNRLLIIGLICTSVSSASFSQTNGQRYYYAFNKKIFLNEVENKMVVCFQRNNAADAKARLQTERAIQKNDSVCIVYAENSQRAILRRDLLQLKGVKSVQPMYVTDGGWEMPVTDEIIMRFNKDVSQQQIDEIHRKYQVRVKKTTDLYQVVTVPPDADALEIANQYQLSGLVKYSHPNFLMRVEMQSIPNDPYFANQFYLHNTGDSIIKFIGNFTNGSKLDTIKLPGTPGADIRAPEAWDITKGDSSIVIAVIDLGVTYNHPDLPNSRQVRLNGSNFGDGNPNDPSPTKYYYQTENYNHGNACAGIIAASHNDEGIAGIAPNCKIMPIRIGKNADSEIFTAAMKFAKDSGAYIISNSWELVQYDSINDNNKKIYYEVIPPDPNAFPSVVDAIEDATLYGRGGKGCVVVFSAGNTADHAGNSNNYYKRNGYIAFPANVTIPGVLSVGASDRYDRQANYSPTSVFDSVNWVIIKNQIVDVVAPSSRSIDFCTDSLDAKEGGEIWTIDLPGDAGDNPLGVSGSCGYPNPSSSLLPYFPGSGRNYDAYTAYFGGTSAAAPQVAGVAALILSVDSNLTQQEVSNIIKSTTRKPKGYTYSYLIDPGLYYNHSWNPQMGYGVLNAYAAVQRALGNHVIYDYTLNDGDYAEAITCGDVYIKDVSLQGNAKMYVEAGKRVIIQPPFSAKPTGEGYFYAGIKQPCNSPKLQSSPPPEAQRANPVPTGIIQPVVREAFLAQNAPNPAREQTVIPYYIPETFRSASLLFTTIMGVRVKQIPIPTGGEGEAAVSVSELPAGMYLYSLLVDGRVVVTKRMLVSR